MTNIKDEFVIKRMSYLKSNTFFLIIFSFNRAFCQMLTENKFHLQSKYSYGIVEGIVENAQYNNFSLCGEFIVSDHIGLNYNFDWMQRNDNIRLIHTPMGLIGGPLLMLLSISNKSGNTTNSGNVGILLGILILALPDGVSYHIPVA